jgi:hypothetical protein
MVRRAACGKAGRESNPSTAIIDSQSVQACYVGGERGYDGSRKVHGRERHIVTDTLGLILAVVVCSAGLADSQQAPHVLKRLVGKVPWLQRVYADQGYRAPAGLIWRCVAWLWHLVERVTESKRKVFDFTGAIDISEVVGEKLAASDADALINTQIAIKSTVPDFFINLFTLGIANVYTIEVTGELVQAPEGLSTLIEEGTVLGRAASLDALTLDAETAGAAGRDAVLVRHDGAYLLVQPGR